MTEKVTALTAAKRLVEALNLEQIKPMRIKREQGGGPVEVTFALFDTYPVKEGTRVYEAFEEYAKAFGTTVSNIVELDIDRDKTKIGARVNGDLHGVVLDHNSDGSDIGSLFAETIETAERA